MAGSANVCPMKAREATLADKAAIIELWKRCALTRLDTATRIVLRSENGWMAEQIDLRAIEHLFLALHDRTAVTTNVGCRLS
jgi:hypothetical protein